MSWEMTTTFMYIAVSSMEGPSHRLWMYCRKDNRTGELCDEFITGLKNLIGLLDLIMSTSLMEFTIVLVPNVKIQSTLPQMMLNYIFTK